ncbi:MAG: SAM-dependent methyltransferase [Kiritimatiellia bacterium]
MMNWRFRLIGLRPVWALSVIAIALFAMGREDGEVNVSRHLGIVGRVNLGSFYTPAKYVRRVGEWLLKHHIGKGWTIADLSCGYGAFFELSEVDGLSECRYVGNDIDSEAVDKAREFFPNVEWSVKNALKDVSRANFGFSETERIVLVGNPPYNDITSQINQKLKKRDVLFDPDVKTRDLGMSSLLAYNKLKAEYVVVLHPLSYLVKKANFSATRSFFSNYQLVEHVVFPSSEFAGTSKVSSFPVIVGMYRREEGNGLSYDDVCGMWFRTIEGDEFSLSGFDYVTDEIDKYPSGRRYEREILFYTMRDINALRRSRTFIPRRTSNAVDIDPHKLSYYCYVDCFKRYADIPYYLGNFNVPFIRDEFSSIEGEVLALSKFMNPEIFGQNPKPDPACEARVKAYIARCIKGKDRGECRPMRQRSSMARQAFSSICQ